MEMGVPAKYNIEPDRVHWVEITIVAGDRKLLSQTRLQHKNCLAKSDQGPSSLTLSFQYWPAFGSSEAEHKDGDYDCEEFILSIPQHLGLKRYSATVP